MTGTETVRDSVMKIETRENKYASVSEHFNGTTSNCTFLRDHKRDSFKDFLGKRVLFRNFLKQVVVFFARRDHDPPATHLLDTYVLDSTCAMHSHETIGRWRHLLC